VTTLRQAGIVRLCDVMLPEQELKVLRYKAEAMQRRLDAMQRGDPAAMAEVQAQLRKGKR
jgi:hypothetical protein